MGLVDGTSGAGGGRVNGRRCRHATSLRLLICRTMVMITLIADGVKK